MKYLIFTFFTLFIYSCTSSLDVKISDDKAYDYLEKICEDIDTTDCKSLRSTIKRIEKYRLVSEGDLIILEFFDKPYDKLTFKDLLPKNIEE